MKDDIEKTWQTIALGLGDNIYRSVNTSEMVGTEDETGYILMFFNASHHEGKSTLVSSCTSREDIKQLLQFAIDQVDGPKSTIIERGDRG